LRFQEEEDYNEREQGSGYRRQGRKKKLQSAKFELKKYKIQMFHTVTTRHGDFCH
jgi:hypothetical protein